MSLTVVGPNTRIFRTVITNVSAKFHHFMGEGIYFTLNFDSGFRTFTSGKAQGVKPQVEPEWSGEEFKFNYETNFSNFLAAKIFTFNFKNSNGEFLGDAKGELLTLATGPQDCQFTISDGSRPVGTMVFKVEMEEVAETVVDLIDLYVEFNQGAQLPADMPAVRALVSTKGHPDHVRVSPAPGKCRQNSALWSRDQAPDSALEKNYFGTTFTKLIEEAGLNVTIVEAGWFSETEYGKGFISIGKLDTTAMTTNPRDVPFRGVDLMDPQGNKVIGRIDGRLGIAKMPVFVQMHSGRNVDGVVEDGQVVQGATKMPPRIKGEVKKFVRV